MIWREKANLFVLVAVNLTSLATLVVFALVNETLTIFGATITCSKVASTGFAIGRIHIRRCHWWAWCSCRRWVWRHLGWTNTVWVRTTAFDFRFTNCSHDILFTCRCCVRRIFHSIETHTRLGVTYQLDAHKENYWLQQKLHDNYRHSVHILESSCLSPTSSQKSSCRKYWDLEVVCVFPWIGHCLIAGSHENRLSILVQSLSLDWSRTYRIHFQPYHERHCRELHLFYSGHMLSIAVMCLLKTHRRCQIESLDDLDS